MEMEKFRFSRATKTELKLISTLKQYFPLAVNLFADVGLKSEIALNFLSRWPTLEELHRAKAQTVRSFFYAHNSRSQSLIEKRLQLIAQAHPVTDDLALIEPLVLTRGSPKRYRSRRLRRCRQYWSSLRSAVGSG